jgi:hypothetical protein
VRPQVKTLNDIRRQFPKHAEAFDSLITAHENVAAQLATDPNGSPITPAVPAQLVVQHQNGFVDMAVVDNSPISRAINYYVELADNEGFSGYHTIPLGPSRNGHDLLPNGNWWLRVRSQYPAGGPASAPSQAVAISIGGSPIGALTLLPSQGSGTGGGGAGSIIKRK